MENITQKLKTLSEIKSRTVSCRISNRMYQELEDLALENRTKRSILFRHLIEKYLQESKIK